MTSTNGTLTITPAPLTVTAANATCFTAIQNPVFTGTITGIKNGDNITARLTALGDCDQPGRNLPHRCRRWLTQRAS